MCMNKITYPVVRKEKEKEKDTIVKTDQMPVHVDMCTIIIVIFSISLFIRT